MREIINLLTAVAIPPLSSWSAFLLLRSPRCAFYAGWLFSALSAVIGMAAERQWFYAAIAAANALLAVFLWWRHRHRRKRAPRAYGAKSRALVQSLVRRARGHARPRPVLRPLPSPG